MYVNFFKIQDFNFNKSDTRHESTINRCYKAPEVQLQNDEKIYTEQSDLWSVGCILFEMYANEALFYSEKGLIFIKKHFGLYF